MSNSVCTTPKRASTSAVSQHRVAIPLSDTASTMASNHAVANTTFIAMSDIMDTPPGYQEHVERSITPFPRPHSPTPSQLSANIFNNVAQASWPFDERNGARPDSALSYTSQRLHKAHRVKSLSRKIKKNRPYSPHPGPVAGRPGKRKRSGSSNYNEHGMKAGRVQVPSLAHLAARKGERALQHVISGGSLGSFNMPDPSSNQQRKGQRGSPKGKGTRLSKGFFRIFHTQGGVVKASGSQQSIRGQTIGPPTGFRHEGGANLGADRSGRTMSALMMDFRTESRTANQTGLPVTMPKAVSPICMTDIGAGFDVPRGQGSIPSSTNPFHSPVSPRTSIRRPRSLVTPAAHVLSRPVRAGTRKAPLCGTFPERNCFWVLVVGTQVMVVSLTASFTCVIGLNSQGFTVRAGFTIWLALSIVGFVVCGVFLTALTTRRFGSRLARKAREDALRDEEWIQVTNQVNKIEHPLQDIVAHRAVLTQVDEEARDKAWKQFASDPVQLRHYVEHIERRNEELSGARNRYKRASGIFNAADIGLPNESPRMAGGQNESAIGIARSESLIVERVRNGSGASTYEGSAESYDSVATEKPIVPRAAPIQSNPSAVEDFKSTAVTDEDADVTRTPFSTGIPRSEAMPNLSSQVDLSVSNSNTKSTIGSLIGSYAVSEGDDKSGNSHTRADEPLGSHPVNVNDLRTFITEAGTPNSEKSVDRLPAAPTHEPRHERNWSVRDGVTSRMTTMTPIEERSEAASAKSFLYA